MITIYHLKDNLVQRPIVPLFLERYQLLNFDDTLSFSVLDDPLGKLDNIVYKDERGIWHEYTVQGVEDEHKSTGKSYSVFAENSVFDQLSACWIEGIWPQDRLAVYALTQILEGTGWEVGRVDDLGSNSKYFYRCSVWEALKDLANTWGGEIQTRVTCDGKKITHRYIDLLTAVGSDAGKRFEYTKDITEITKTMSRDDICTALYGFGKGEEVGDGYGRRIDFADVNGGKTYVEDLDALAVFGKLNADGTRSHRFGKAEFDQIDDPQTLLEATRAELAVRSVPQVSYSASVIDLAKYGYTAEGTDIGDVVTVIDNDLGIRVRARVLEIYDYPLGWEESKLVIGNFTDNLERSMADMQKTLKDYRSKSAVWDRSNAINPDGSINAAIVDGIMAEWNSEMNNGLIAGEIITFPGGFQFVNDDQAWATEISTAGIRIANTKDTNGNWIWRTIGTGDGWAAEEMFAGTVLARIAQVDFVDATDVRVNDTLTVADAVTGTAADIQMINQALTTKVSQDGYDLDIASIVNQLTGKADADKLTELADAQAVMLQTQTDWIVAVQQVQETTGNQQTTVDQVLNWMRFGVDGLNIGKSDSSLAIRIDNERLSFLDGGTVVAYMEGAKLYIDSAQITHLQMGNHIADPYSTTHTIIRWAEE